MTCKFFGAFVAIAISVVACVHDDRTVGSFIDDAAIESKANRAIAADKMIGRNSHVNVTSINGLVLITGETGSQESRNRVLELVRSVNGVRRAVNEVQVIDPSSMTDRSRDTWLTSKVKTKLMADKSIDSNRIKVVTERSTVYLMGLITEQEAQNATRIAQSVNGIQRIVKLFEYVD